MKTVPFTKEDLKKISISTPYHIYDETGIRKTAKEFIKAFSLIKGYNNYFAVKALPNPHILKLLKEEGFGADCSSMPELLLCEQVGITGENIMFSSNNTPQEEFKKAFELGAIINLDDISHIEFLEKSAGVPKIICFRYNPGNSREGGNSLIGKPVEAKYGLTKEQMIEAYQIMKKKGVKRFGIHTMVVSNERNEEYLIETADMLIDLVIEIGEKLNIVFEFINLGGGVGIPYKPEEHKVDLEKVSLGIKKLYDTKIVGSPHKDIKIISEFGRAITGPHGYLVSTVKHMKHTYRDYVGLDSCMTDLMRPGIYGAYHHITVLGKENLEKNKIYDVTGSLCENNDKFAIQRSLPKIEIGDIVVIHDTGAHGHAMGFNYNGKLRHAEFLMQKDGSFKMIRRAETIKDYFATLNF